LEYQVVDDNFGAGVSGEPAVRVGVPTARAVLPVRESSAAVEVDQRLPDLFRAAGRG
jgi:hypothetical protein